MPTTEETFSKLEALSRTFDTPKTVATPDTKNQVNQLPKNNYVTGGKREEKVLSVIGKSDLSDKSKAALAANLKHESNGFTATEVGLHFKDPQRLVDLLANRTNPNDRPTLEEATAANNAGPKAVAKLYFGGDKGIELGNRPDTEDYWTYRAQGDIQLTGRSNYERAAKATGYDLVNNPGLLKDPEVSAAVAVAFWKDSGADGLANQGNLDAARARVSGSNHGKEGGEGLAKVREYSDDYSNYFTNTFADTTAITDEAAKLEQQAKANLKSSQKPEQELIAPTLSEQIGANAKGFDPVAWKKNSISQQTQNKMESILGRSQEVQSKFSPYVLPNTYEEAVAQGLNISPEQFAMGKQEEILKEKIYQTKQERTNLGSETGLDMAQDLSLATAQFAVDTGGIVYGIGQLQNRLTTSLANGAYEALTGEKLGLKNVEELTGGFSKNFKQTNEFIDDLKTDDTKLSQKIDSLQTAYFDVRSEERIDKDIADGYSPIEAALKEGGRGFVNSLENLTTNEAVLADAVIRSAPNILIGAGIGKVVAGGIQKSAVARMGIKEAETYLASAAGQKVMATAASRSNVAFVAVQEGFSNGLDAKAQVLNTSLTEIAKLDEVKQMMKANPGMTLEDARMQLSDDAFDITTAISGVAGGLISKGTGSAHVVGNLLNNVPTKQIFKGVLGKVIKPLVSVSKGPVSEAFEEGGQGASGAIAGNIGIDATLGGKDIYDAAFNTAALKGAGKAAAHGFLTGAYSSGAFTAIPAADRIGGMAYTGAKGLGKGAFAIGAGVVGAGKAAYANKGVIGDIAKSTVNTAKNVSGVLKDSLGKVIETNPESEKYNPRAAAQASLSALNTESGTPEHAEQLMAIRPHLAAFGDEIGAIGVKYEAAMKAGNQAEAVKLGKELESKTARMNDFMGLYSEIQAAHLANKVKLNNNGQNAATVLRNTEATTEQLDEAAYSVVGSGGFNTTNQKALEQVINNERVSPDIRGAAQASLNVLQATEKLKKEGTVNKSTGQVSSEVVDGGKNKFGAKQYDALIRSAMNDGDGARASKALGALENFAQAQNHKLNLLKSIKQAQLAGEDITALAQEYNDLFPGYDKDGNKKAFDFKPSDPAYKVGGYQSIINNLYMENEVLAATIASGKALMGIAGKDTTSAKETVTEAPKDTGQPPVSQSEESSNLPKNEKEFRAAEILNAITVLKEQGLIKNREDAKKFIEATKKVGDSKTVKDLVNTGLDKIFKTNESINIEDINDELPDGFEETIGVTSEVNIDEIPDWDTPNEEPPIDPPNSGAVVPTKNKVPDGYKKKSFLAKTVSNIVLFVKAGQSIFANKGQAEALVAIKDFFNTSGQKEFILTGRGGTGKTTIIKKAISDLIDQSGGSITAKNILAIAPSHKAKKVLRNSLGQNITTITLASALGLKIKYGPKGEVTFVPDTPFGNLTSDGDLADTKLSNPEFKYIIIDESSMISEEHLAGIREQAASMNKKIIFMGDPAQLPPIGDAGNSKVFDISIGYNLLEKMRQTGNSPIINIGELVAEAALESHPDLSAITPDMRFNIHDPVTGSSVKWLSKLKDALDQFVEDYKKNPDKLNGTKIVTFNKESHNSPQSVGNLNKAIRSLLHGMSLEELSKPGNGFFIGESITAYVGFNEEGPDGKPTPVVFNADDYIVDTVTYEPNYKIESANNTVLNDKYETPNFIPSYGVYFLTLKNSEGATVLSNGKPVTIPVIAAADTNRFQSDITSLFSSGNRRERGIAAKMLNMFGDFHHNYAITSHKAQGSTYSTVYVMEDNILGSGGNNKSKNQSLYVAVSRPTTKLVMVSNKNASVDQTVSINIEELLGETDSTTKAEVSGVSGDTQENSDIGAESKVTLKGKSPFLAKDQAKADQANKFIGRGAEGSSTAQYAKDFGKAANTGEYAATDKVFVSANGARGNRIAPDFVELQKAIDAGATIITDTLTDRTRAFNLGEREVANYLVKQGYIETEGNGVWNKAKATPASAAAEDVTPEAIKQSSETVAAVEKFKQAVKDKIVISREQAIYVINSKVNGKERSEETKAALMAEVDKIFPKTETTSDISVTPNLSNILNVFGANHTKETLDVMQDVIDSMVNLEDSEAVFTGESYERTNGIDSKGFFLKLLSAMDESPQKEILKMVIARLPATSKIYFSPYSTHFAHVIKGFDDIIIGPEFKKAMLNDDWSIFEKMLLVYSSMPHEAMHIISNEALDKDPQFSKEVDAIFEEIQKVLPNGLYGLTNKYEFLAELFISEPFQDVLMKTKPSDTLLKQLGIKTSNSLWDTIVKTLGKYLGLELKDNNYLSLLMTIVDNSTALSKGAVTTSEALAEAPVVQAPITDSKTPRSYGNYFENIGTMDVKGLLAKHSLSEIAEIIENNPDYTPKQKEFAKRYVGMAITISNAAKAVMQKDHRAGKENQTFNSPPKTALIKALQTNKFEYEQALFDAIGLAGATWLATMGAKTVFNDDDALRAILGLGVDDVVDERYKDLLSRVGSPQNTIAEAIGKLVIENLNIKFAKNGVAIITEGELALSIGQNAIASLVEGKLLKITQLPVTMFDFETIDQVTDTENDKFTPYVTIPTESVIEAGKKDPIDQAIPVIKELADSFNLSGNKKVVAAITDSEIVNVMPTEEAPAAQGKKLKGTTQHASKEQIEIAKKDGSRAYELNEMDALTSSLSEAAREEIYGIRYDLDNLHETERKSLEAINDSKRRSLNNWQIFKQEMVDSFKNGLSSKFHIKHDIWSNTRVGGVGIINPQADKHVRHHISSEAWKATIDINDKGQMDLFKLAVLEGLGVNVNKLTEEQRNKEFEKVLNEPIYQNAVKAINTLTNRPGEKLEEGANAEQAVVAGAKKGKEEFWSLHALSALSQYDAAVASYTIGGDSKFTTSLFREVDGITNGVILGLMQFGGASSFEELMRMLNKGGVYVEGSYKSYNDFITEFGNLDSYEDLADSIHKNLNIFKEKLQGNPAWVNGLNPDVYKRELEKQNKMIDAAIRLALGGSESMFDEETGKVSKAARTLSKLPLMTIIYGASSYKVVENLAAGAIYDAYARAAKIHTKLENNAFEKDETAASEEAKFDAIERDLNTLIGGGFPVKITAKNARTFRLSNSQFDSFIGNFRNTFGKALEKSIEEKYGIFLERRAVFNDVVELSYNVFKKRLVAQIAIMEEQLGRGISKNELETIIDSLQDISPIVASYFGKSLKEGLLFTKQKKVRRRFKEEKVLVNGKYVTKRVEQKGNIGFGNKIEDLGLLGSTPSVVKTELGKPIPTTKVIFDGKDWVEVPGTIKYMEGQPSELAIAPPGVAGGVILTHHMDASIMMETINGHDVLNVHDAVAGNILDTDKFSKAINENMLKVFKNYDFMEKLTDLFNRVATNATPNEVSQYRESFLEVRDNLIKHLDESSALRKQLLDSNLIIGQYDSASPDGTYKAEGATKDLGNEANKTINTAVNTNINNSAYVRKAPINWDATKNNKYPSKKKPNLQYTYTYQGQDEFYIQSIGGGETNIWGADGNFITTVKGAHNQTVINKTIAKLHSEKQIAILEMDKQDIFNIEQAKKTVDEMLAHQKAKEEAARIEAERISKLNNDTLGSSGEVGIDPNEYNGKSGIALTANNLVNTFDGLDTLGNIQEDAEHQGYLRGVLSALRDNLYRPLSLYMLSDRPDQNVGEFNFRKGIIGLQAAMSSGQRTLVSGLRMSMQEVFAHEAVHAITFHGINKDSAATRKLKRLFDIAAANTTVEDLMNQDANGYTDSQGVPITPGTSAWQHEYDMAKQRYDYMFNNKSAFDEKHFYGANHTVASRNPYLQEFMAIGLTNKNYGKKLRSIGMTSKELYAPKTDNLFTRLQNLFDFIVARITGNIQERTIGNAQEALMALAYQLSENEQRAASLLENKVDRLNTTTGEKLDEWVIQPLKRMSTGAIANAGIPVVSPLAGAVRAASNLNEEGIEKGLRKFFANSEERRDSLIYNITTDFLGPIANHKEFHNLMRVVTSRLDHARKAESTFLAKDLLKQFTRELVDKEKISITQAALMTDLSSIWRNPLNKNEVVSFDLQQIDNMLNDSTVLNEEIQKLLDLLKAAYPEQFNIYKGLSLNLANFMVTKEVKYNGDLIMNAKGIAEVVGLQEAGIKKPANTAYAESIIEVLTTLNALAITPNSTKTTLSNLINTQSDGIKHVLANHQVLKDKSLESSFENQSLLMRKGFVPDMNNPYKSFKVGTFDEGVQLLKYGYQRIGPVNQERIDPNQANLFMYVSPYSQQGTLDSGIVSYTNMTANGTDIIHNYMQANDEMAPMKAIADLAKIKKDKMAYMKAMAAGKPVAAKAAVMLPVRDSVGNITNYRYVMSESMRRDIFEKQESFEHVIGHMAGHIIDITETKWANREAVILAKRDFDENFHRDPTAYIRISPESSEAKIRELYKMFPREMHLDIKELWGDDGMYVHAAVYKTMFGQRKLGFNSLTIQDTTDLESLALMKARVNNLLTTMFHNKFGLALETNWKDLITMAKDTIVIRSIEVLVANIASNQLTLLMLGVNPVSGMKDQIEAYEAAKAFQILSQEISDHKRKMAIDPVFGNSDAAQVTLSRLRENLAGNRVFDLMNAGVYQSITEDVYTLEDTSAFKTKMEEKFDPYFEKINPKVRKVINVAAMRHGTPVYETLKDMTQLSDFMARYALHKHNMKKGMSSENSINNIVETFINYDAPTDKWLQYANDVGLLMFTKYFIRNQRVIAQVAKDRPASAATAWLLQTATGFNLPDIFDSTLLTLPSMNDPLEVISNGLSTHPLYYLWKSLFG